MLNIFPEKIIRTRDQDGNMINSEVYSIDAWVNLGFFQIILLLIIGAVIAPLVSLIILIIYIFEANKVPKMYNIIGVLVSVYYLLDLKHDWVISMLTKSTYSADGLHWAIYGNLTLALTHLVLFFFGGLVNKIAGGNNLISFLIISTLLFFDYFASIYLLGNHIIKVL